MCLVHGPQRSDAGEARTRGPSVSPPSHCAPMVCQIPRFAQSAYMNASAIGKLFYGFASVWAIIHSLKLVDYLPIQTHEPYRRTNHTTTSAYFHFSPPNLTFWTGLFRPYQNEDKWFKLYKTQCKPISMGNVIDNTYCDQQCLTLTFVDYNGTTTAGSANCLDKLPYTCIASAGKTYCPVSQ